MKKRCLLLIISFACLVPPVSLAQIYMYEDADGVRHYTNVPTSSRYKPVRLGRLNTEPGKRYRSVNRRAKRAQTNPALFDSYIRKAASTHKIDPLLIKAIIKAESNFDQYAVSSKGAQGLMQLMPATARDMRVRNPFDPGQNISGGSRYFRKLLSAYDGDLALSLAAYNAGPGRVSKKGPLPAIKETREYVSRVMQNYRYYQQRSGSGGNKSIKVGKLVTYN